MSDETNKATSRLLYKTTLDVLRLCRGSNPGKSAEALAHCANPNMVDILRSNEALLRAIALDYATRVAADLPPVKSIPAPTKTEEWSVRLVEPQAEK